MRPTKADWEREDAERGLPFPGSLCNRCAAPPRYIRTERSVFIRCPILKIYPPQPVRECKAFVPGTEPDRRPAQRSGNSTE